MGSTPSMFAFILTGKYSFVYGRNVNFDRKCVSLLTFGVALCRIQKNCIQSLIKSGGGNGPMKPSNLLFKVLNPAATKDEDSIDRASNPSVCGFFIF